MKKQHRLSGQTLVEFALLIPFLLTLLIGFFDIGRAIFYYSSLSNAVREGTRFSIVTQDITEDEIKDKVLEYAFALADTPHPLEQERIEIERSSTHLSITATYTFQSILFRRIEFDLVAQSKMRLSPHNM